MDGAYGVVVEEQFEMGNAFWLLCVLENCFISCIDVSGVVTF